MYNGSICFGSGAEGGQVSVQAGIWNFDGAPVVREALAKISSHTAEYGPDGEEIWSNGSVALLYRPFHTTPESRLEHQPYTFADGKVMTWDGRLDNRDELAAQLGLGLNVNSTDVEIVAAAYERWATECLRRLIGDWALTIWNPRGQELLLSRDYVGIKPLFYYCRCDRVAWSSYLPSLALCGDKFTICEEFVASYLAFHPDAHLTPYQDILSVPPGNFVRIRRTGGMSIHSYRNLNSESKTTHKTDADYEEHYRYVLRQAVRRRLRTDTPVLAGLSGGFDSTSIVCMADNILAQEGAFCPRLDTFSYYDLREPDDDDLIYIEAVEKRRGKPSIHCDMAGSGDSLRLNTSDFFGSPGFGLREEITPVLSDTIQQGNYRVNLSGTGGDEINGQPLDFRIQMADLLVQARLMDMAKQLVSWSLLTRRPWIHLFLQSVLELLPTTLRVNFIQRAKIEPWVNPAFARKYSMSKRQLEHIKDAWLIRPSSRDAIQTLASLSGQMTHTPPSLIEQRYPYLDETFVDFMSSIPLDQLLRPGQRRSLMRRSLRSLLPIETLTRKTKAAAARCYCVTLEKHWECVERNLHSSLTSRFGFCDEVQLRRALSRMRDGQVTPYFTRLLKALSLELWLRNVVRRGIVSVPLNTFSSHTGPAALPHFSR
jgi:asparagine synthase (glutamine-hydrolysing)